MRMGAFLFGGLVGAAAVYYFSQRNKPMFFGAFSSMGTKKHNSQHDEQTSAGSDKGVEKFDFMQEDPTIYNTQGAH